MTIKEVDKIINTGIDSTTIQDTLKAFEMGLEISQIIQKCNFSKPRIIGFKNHEKALMEMYYYWRRDNEKKAIKKQYC